ncbi:hypothetical protein ACFL6C_02215 [Myxococcota bacterium]
MVNAKAVKFIIMASLCSFTLAGRTAWGIGPAADVVKETVFGGPLQMGIRGRIVLGRDASAELVLTPSEGTKPVLLVSTGSISQPTEAEGRLVATYTPSKDLFPHVAIIAAVNEAGWLLDWLAVPLHGETTIRTKTEANASVVVRIGSNEFGPVTADRRGDAQVGVIVPPGIRFGTTIARDGVGNVKETTFELNVPAFNRVLNICPRTVDRVFILAVGPKGAPLVEESFELNSSLGTLTQPRPIGPGVYESILTLPLDSQVGAKVTLGAAIIGDMVSQTSCSATLRKGWPATVKLHVEPPVYVAGSGTPIAIAVEFLDADGGPAQPIPLEIDADIGEVSKVHVTPGGEHRAIWRFPDAFTGRKRGLLEVRPRTAQVISAEAVVELQAGPLSRLELSADATQLRADGHSTAVISATGYDATGNVAIPTGLVATAEGHVGAFSANGGGEAHQATYTAPYSFREQQDSIIVRSEKEDAETALQIQLRPGPVRTMLSAKAGYFTNLGRISSALIDTEFAVRLPVLDDRLSVGVEAMFYWSDRSEDLTNGQATADLSLWAVPLLIRGTYRIPFEQLTFYAGIAVGISIVGRKITSPTDAPIETIENHPTLSGHVGADVSLGPGRVAFEVAYLYPISEGTTVRADLGGLLLTGGYRFEL